MTTKPATGPPDGLIARRLTPRIRSSRRSVLLLGPRQTGKSTLIRGLEPDLTINLARETEYLAFARNPGELEQRLAASTARTVFIDEVQRLPSLLNTIQALLDERPGRWRFLLTGSSARKLRRGRANLLPGRVHQYRLGPITSAEAGYALDTRAALSTGTLPAMLTERDVAERRRTLASYAATYVREEVQAEALTRNLEGFSRFIFLAAAAASSFLDLSRLAREAGVPRQSVVRYFEVLEDTLLVLRAEAFSRSVRRRLVLHPRTFFFDNGVLNGLLGGFEVSADRVGPLFENLMAGQLVHSAHASGEELRLSTYRTSNGAEVDFIVEHGGMVWAIEAKASASVGRADLSGLRSFAEFYGRPHRAVVATTGGAPRKLEGVDVLPWQELLREMGL
jgi:predicted AAA+ superfamily ATPase